LKHFEATSQLAYFELHAFSYLMGTYKQILH